MGTGIASTRSSPTGEQTPPRRSYGPPGLTDDEFKLFQRLVYREAGIHLGESKRALVVSRLTRRVRGLGLDCFGQYYRRVVADEQELVRMLDHISTNETSFFREPGQFTFLESQVFPRWREAALARGRPPYRVRAWSAGCSTGEEPFSVGMSLLDHFPPEDGFEVEVVATDLSTRVLRQARAATWSLDKSIQIPHHYLKRYMRRGVGNQAGRMRASRKLQNTVSFERVNLSQDQQSVRGTFDLIFCRNVLIYFEAESKRKALQRLLRSLSPHGYLLLGHSEALLGTNHRLRTVAPSIFTWQAP
jgi:chemotaxis protein methyltransferase CheR